MLARKTCAGDPRWGTATVFPLRSMTPDVLSPEEFKAAHVASRQNDQGVARVQPDEEWSHEIQDDIDLAGEQRRSEQYGS